MSVHSSQSERISSHLEHTPSTQRAAERSRTLSDLVFGRIELPLVEAEQSVVVIESDLDHRDTESGIEQHAPCRSCTLFGRCAATNIEFFVSVVLRIAQTGCRG